MSSGAKSCVGCKFLYAQDEGYSNYTVEDTDIHCAMGRNASLPASKPYDWEWNIETADNWPATNASRCERYVLGKSMPHFDVDGDETALTQAHDLESLLALISDGRGIAEGVHTLPSGEHIAVVGRTVVAFESREVARTYYMIEKGIIAP